MNILVINQYGQYALVDSPVVPRVGEHIDRFYRPMPTVDKVIMWPQKETIDELKININREIHVLVFVW